MKQEHGGDCLVERRPFGKEAQDRPPRAPALGEVEEEQVALGKIPGGDGIAEVTGRALMGRVIRWVNFLEKLVRQRLRNAIPQQALLLANAGLLNSRSELSK